MSGPSIDKNTSPSTQEIIDSTPPDPPTRPPAPTPVEPQNVTPDELYDDPDELRSRQKSVASIASCHWPPPYDEIRIQFNDTPPAIPPARKQTTAAARATPRPTSLPASFPEGRAMAGGTSDRTSGKADTIGRAESTENPQSHVYQNERTSTLPSRSPLPNPVITMLSTDVQYQDVLETKRTSLVIPPPPRKLSKDNLSSKAPCAPPATENEGRQYGNIPIPSNTSDPSVMPPTTEARELSDSNRPALSQNESRDSITLDPDGYIKCIP